MARANILVIKLGALGDFIQALGPMAAIRAAHPDDHITLLTTKPFESLASASGYFDDILIDKRPKWHDVGGWLSLRKNLNEKNFARVYDLQNNDRTEFYLKLFSPRPEWIGAAAGASHRNTSPERSAGKAFYGHVQTLALAGIHNVQVDPLSWMKGRDDYEGLKDPFVLIVAGGSKQHPEKRWPVSQYAAFCKMLLARNILPVLIGGDAEADVTAAIGQGAQGCLDLTGQTSLFDIAALARRAMGAVGNDTGPMHIIAPTGCKSLVLFSKNTNPNKHGPLGRDIATLQKENLNDLSPDDVWKAFAAQQPISL